MKTLSNGLAILGLTAMAIAPLTAGAAQESGFYVGASAGKFTVDEDRLDDDDAGLLKAFAGFQVNPLLGLEASWVDFDRTTGQANNFKSDGFTAAASLRVPSGERSAFFVKLGEYWWNADATLAGVTVSADGNDMLWG